MSRGLLVLFTALAAGCGADPPPAPAARSDPDAAGAADVRILFVGNSHTTGHDLSDLVARMIRFQKPGKTVSTLVLPAGHLDDAAADGRAQAEIDSRRWTHVVLQGQRISVSGRFEYSRAEGIDLAKRAAAAGATVVYYAEWGLRDQPGDGPRTAAVYQQMADATGGGATVAPVARAWDLALADRPDLSLYEADGNHQSATGAFLTVCVLAAHLTGESPAGLAAFPYPDVSAADRRALAGYAAAACGR